MSDMDSKYSVFLSNLLSHQDRLYGYIFALVPNITAVDDLVQETILVMWEKFDTFEPGTNYFAWAKKIAYYKVINYLERSHHSDIHFSKEVLESIEKQTDVFEKSDIRVDALENCLKKLKGPDKELIKLKYVEGLTIKEVAVKTTRSIHGMYKIMARIHNMLENCIKRALMNLEDVS